MTDVKEYYTMARELWHQGRFIEALAVCDDGITASNDDVSLCGDLYYLKSQILMKLGDLEDAMENYEILMSSDDWKLPAMINCGVILSVLGRYEEALEMFDKALELDPGNHPLLYNKALVLMQSGRGEEALGIIRRYWSLDKDESDDMVKTDEYGIGQNEALMMMARIYDSMGQYYRAIECYDRIIDSNPEDIKARNMKAIVLGEIGRYREALEYIDSALKTDPQNTELLATKGITLYKNGQYKEAIRCLDSVLEFEGNKSHRNDELLSIVRAVRLESFRKFVEEQNTGKHSDGTEG